MELKEPRACCDLVSQTGPLSCAKENEGKRLEGPEGEQAWLFELTDGRAMLGWRRREDDPWNFSSADEILVLSATNPAGEPANTFPEFTLVAGLSPSSPRSDGRAWWHLRLREGNTAPFTALRHHEGFPAVYPVAIVSSLGSRSGEEARPSLLLRLQRSLALAMAKVAKKDPNPWPWERIGAGVGGSAQRKVKIAILDNGYTDDALYRDFVVADCSQDMVGSGIENPNRADHGPRCLLFAAEVVLRTGMEDSISLLPYRVFDRACGTEQVVLEALQHARSQGVEIVVAPWFLKQDNTALEEEVRELENAGILFLTGPVNEKLDLDDCPCAQQMAHWSSGNIGVVGVVGAVGPEKRRPAKDQWPYCWGRSRVDAGAPGQGLFSRLDDTYGHHGSSFAVSIAGALVAVELSRRADPGASALSVWQELIAVPPISRCRAHSTCDHCVSKGVLHFT